MKFSDRNFALLLFALALALRLAANPPLSFARNCTGDTGEYVLLGRMLAEHGTFAYSVGADPTPFRTPGYPLVVAAAFLLSPGHVEGLLYFFNLVLGAGVPLLVFLAARGRGSPGDLSPETARTAGLLALFPGFDLPATTMTENLAGPIVAASLALTARMSDGRPGLGRGVLLGLVNALAGLTRAVTLAPIAGILLAFAPRLDRRALVTSLALTGAILGGWTLRNSAVSGGFVGLDATFGYNLLVAHDPATIRVPNFRDDLFRTLEEGNRASWADTARKTRGAAFRNLAVNPSLHLPRTLWKWHTFFGLSLRDLRERLAAGGGEFTRSALLPGLALAIPTAVFLALAVCGLVLRHPAEDVTRPPLLDPGRAMRDPGSAPLLAASRNALLLTLASHTVFFAMVRYRIPIEACLCLLAAASLETLASGIRALAPGRRRLLFALLALMIWSFALELVEVFS